MVGRAELLSSLLYILTFCCYRQAISKEEEDRSGITSSVTQHCSISCTCMGAGLLPNAYMWSTWCVHSEVVRATSSCLVTMYILLDSIGNKWLALSLTLCLLSVLSKEQGLTAVAVCFLYDIFIHNQVYYTEPSVILYVFPWR